MMLPEDIKKRIVFFRGRLVRSLFHYRINLKSRKQTKRQPLCFRGKQNKQLPWFISYRIKRPTTHHRSHSI